MYIHVSLQCYFPCLKSLSSSAVHLLIFSLVLYILKSLYFAFISDEKYAVIFNMNHIILLFCMLSHFLLNADIVNFSSLDAGYSDIFKNILSFILRHSQVGGK